MALDRKSNDQVLERDSDPIINEKHINDWTQCVKGDGYKFASLRQRNNKPGSFNYYAAESTPKSVRYRQLSDNGPMSTTAGDSTYERGDYLFIDASGGKVVVPFKLFQLLVIC